ncbi:hypothetical protein ACH427_04585 [Streptomyces sp. NPDC020379]|uniref:hypothetical protein n=1 Tax=Streptomyces sp. NPDC020379 TaxID=3365071 RepID=UPI0037BA36CE
MSDKHKLYWVDWSDPHFPQVRHKDEARSYESLQTFTGAKQEIREHFQAQLDHARARIREVNALRVKDVETAMIEEA